MRFRQTLTSSALLALAALLAADPAAHAGARSGQAGGGKKSTLGASYANRRTGAGSHVPGKSGIVKPASTGSSGLGASRAITSKSAGEAAESTSRPAGKRARPTRPIKSRAEERAVQAREEASRLDSAAAGAEREAGQAREEVTFAARKAEVSERALATARRSVTRARGALAEAQGAAEQTALQALDDLEALDTIERAAKKKNASKAFRAFISKVSFGLYSPPEDISTLVAEVARRAQKSANAAGRASAARDQAQEALEAAELGLASAEMVAAADRESVQRAEQRARRLESDAGQLRARAGQAAGKAAELEDAADAAAERYQHKVARLDQHRLGLTGAGRQRFKQAARRVKLGTWIESKPAEVSQDALAAAPESGFYAIADGVTNSDFSGQFARALVRRWTERPPADEAELADWLATAQADWAAEIEPLVAGKAAAWYNRNRTWQGDAAFVGARLVQKAGRRKLELTGIGDTVAFLVRGGRIVASFPLERAAEFSDLVKALPSVGAPLHPPLRASWDVQPGDEVFMGTDALAHWILDEAEAGRDPLPTLRAIGSQNQMNKFVAAARDGSLAGHGAMGVDDTALLRFVVPDAD